MSASNVTTSGIVASAEAVFDRHGFAASGVDRVTAAAGVSTRTLYKHLGNKTGLIVAAVLVSAALAAGALLLDPSQGAAWTSSAGPQGGIAATVPVGIVGESAVAGDPSVPSAASVFKDKNVLQEEPGVTF